jgi:hypothetical protein
MALTKITKSGITTAAVDENLSDSAVTTAKIANDAISEEHLDTSAIIDNSELAEVAASNDILLIYDASAGTIKKILSSNVGLTPPIFTSVSPTNVLTGDGTGNVTFTITGSNFDTTATAKLRTTAGVEVTFDSVTRDSSTQITGVISKSSLSNANEPYDVIILNGSNLQAIAADQINIDAQPVYVTASGSLGDQTVSTAGSFSVNATDPESAGNVTFELQSGTLPPGYSITNTAAEGGTAIIAGTDTTTSSTTTYNFVLRAVDAASNTTSRAFSIQSKVPVTESFTSSGTFSVPSGVTETDVLVIAGGGGGGSQGQTYNGGPYGEGGGGAGGLIFIPAYPVTPSGTVTVTVGSGGGTDTNGQNSAFGSPGDPGLGQGNVLTALGGGNGGRSYDQGTPGGSGGGGGYGGQGGCQYYAGSPSQYGQGLQPTQPGQSGAYGFGFAGGTSIGQAGCGGAGGGGASADGLPSRYLGSAGWGGSGGVGKYYTISDGTTPVGYAGGGGGRGGGKIQGNTSALATGGGNIPANFDGPSAQAIAQAVNGVANRGGGGSQNASGGKGVVIVRYS